MRNFDMIDRIRVTVNKMIVQPHAKLDLPLADEYLGGIEPTKLNISILIVLF